MFHKSLPLILAATAMLSHVPIHAEEVWPAPVPGFVPPAPGEHPRLLFRKSDVPMLRQKANTPAGRAMIARLKFLLGGGEAMPTQFNPNPPVNIGAKGPGTLKPGTFTVHHAAGFGLLYQLTGNKKYADLARQCLDKVFEGQVDRDERYSWKAPGTGFRLSGVMQGVALAYDLCYDAWPADYRNQVVTELQTNAPTASQANGALTLEMLAGAGKYPPASNHYGAYIAGPGFAALAIKGDPGADDARLTAVLEKVNGSMKSLFTSGFGDGGWFGEGAGSDKTAILPGITGLILAMRNVEGVDWAEGAPNARMSVMTRALEMVPDAVAVRRPERGQYAHGDRFYDSDRSKFRDFGAGWSSDGLFAIGLGAIPERYRPGLAWIYENSIEPGLTPDKRIYDARTSPLHAVYAFVNWPLAVASENPSVKWPLAVVDTVHGYVLCRNGFKDENDILFTALSRTGPTGYHKQLAPTRVDLWGLGLKASLGALRKGANITSWKPGADGSATFTAGGQAWAVDYSKASGSEGLVVCEGRENLNVALPDTSPPVSDKDLSLAGKWDDGGKKPREFVQTDKSIKIMDSKGGEWMSGTLDGHEASVVVGNNKMELNGQVSPSGMRIDWDNGTHWIRVGYKAPKWNYQPGDKIKSTTVNLGGIDYTVVTLTSTGNHPEPKVEGDKIIVGGQTLTRDPNGLVLGTFTPAP